MSFVKFQLLLFFGWWSSSNSFDLTMKKISGFDYVSHILHNKTTAISVDEWWIRTMIWISNSMSNHNTKKFLLAPIILEWLHLFTSDLVDLSIAKPQTAIMVNLIVHEVENIYITIWRIRWSRLRKKSILNRRGMEVGSFMLAQYWI